MYSNLRKLRNHMICQDFQNFFAFDSKIELHLNQVTMQTEQRPTFNLANGILIKFLTPETETDAIVISIFCK